MAQTGLPDSLARHALFLDVDGTLLDIAPEPGAIVVPAGLVHDLKSLALRAGGAVALVTGRSLDFIETLLPDLGLAVAGLHGAERRDPAGRLVRAEPGEHFEIGRAALQQFAVTRPGILVEHKGAAFAAHYRHQPAYETELRAFMRDLAASMGKDWLLQEGKFVFEIRPAGHDKGDVLRAFMAEPPFLGRTPIAIGDDLTDEAMFSAANELGGLSVKVGESAWTSTAALRLAAPSDVRAWIARLAA